MFTIPSDLTVFSIEGLRDLRRVAAEELATLREATTPESITDDQLERGEALRDFVIAADTEIGTRESRANRFGSLDTPAPATQPDTEPATDPDPAPNPEAEPVAASAEPTGDGAGEPAGEPANDPAPQRVGVAELAPGTPPLPDMPERAFGEHTVMAAADIPGFPTGAGLDNWKQVAEAFVNRTRSYSGHAPLRHPVVEIRREFDNQLMFTPQEARNRETANEKLKFAADESRLDGGSLLAANGWCAPSETLYTTCNQISADGLISLPEVGAPRGGIIHNQGIQFDTVFGSGTGFSILTEAEVTGDTVKTCLEIPCPPFVDDRLKVAALCLTGAILQNRAYPEFVSEFVQGAIAVQAHNVNRDIIEDLVAGSTAVNLSAAAPWVSDTSVASQILSGVEHAILDIKYRLRLPRSATLEVVMPYWVTAQFRADIARRNASPTEFAAADAMVSNWFAMRGARLQYVYDWQDAFADAGVGFGADTALASPPGSVQFLVYPAGTWVLARLDVIRLDSVYDSVNLPQNLVTQLFMEDGYAAMRMCPLSRVYTMPICPSGATSIQQEVCEISS